MANLVIPTLDWIRLTGHYGFAPDFRREKDPESKEIVENFVGHAQQHSKSAAI